MNTMSASSQAAGGSVLATRPDETTLRAAFGRFATGITVITGMERAEPVGFTCQSFHSVSLDPPLVSIGVMATSESYPRLRRGGAFCVNVLAEDQGDVAMRFARRDQDRWRDLTHRPSPNGNPVLDGALTVFDCRIVDEHIVGDHLLVIAEVEAVLSEGQAAAPLVYFRSRFHSLAALEESRVG